MNIFDSKKASIVIVYKTSFPMISIKLDGANYRVWSQIVEMHIAGKRNERYCYVPYPTWTKRGGATRDWDSLTCFSDIGGPISYI